jgi:N-acetylglucosamine-6-phosphate deacetylase
MASERLLIRNAHIYGPVEEWDPGWLMVENGKIALMGAGKGPGFSTGTVAREIDAGGRVLLPGFIDLHAHGAVGSEVMDADPEGIRKLARFYASHGVTSFLATTWAAKREALRRVMQAVSLIAGPVDKGATILGVHLEGPFLNREKTGAQDPEMIRFAEPEEVLEYLNSGLVKLITIAPEFPENLWLIDECVRRGVVVSAGHTSATMEQMKAAAERGLKHVTHCFNAMTPLGHRELGTVGAVMYIPTIHAELIADNIHVDPAAQKILIDIKTPAGVILITDAIRGTGLPDGDYPIDNRTITIRNGEVRLPSGNLAGSVLTMERALKNAVANSGRALKEIWPMSSLNAAREIGVSNCKGSLEVGKDADLVLLEPDFTVAMTVAEGKVVYEK